jgi:hypothetical protein
MWFIIANSFFWMVDPPLQPVEAGSFPDTGCMVPQPYAARGNRSYLGVLCHNRRPVVPRVNYPDRNIILILLLTQGY